MIFKDLTSLTVNLQDYLRMFFKILRILFDIGIHLPK